LWASNCVPRERAAISSCDRSHKTNRVGSSLPQHSSHEEAWPNTTEILQERWYTDPREHLGKSDRAICAYGREALMIDPANANRGNAVNSARRSIAGRGEPYRSNQCRRFYATGRMEFPRKTHTRGVVLQRILIIGNWESREGSPNEVYGHRSETKRQKPSLAATFNLELAQRSDRFTFRNRNKQSFWPNIQVTTLAGDAPRA